MNDIAGVRAIFRSEDQLFEFREKMFKSKARHSLMHDSEKFNYIDKPKATGYRGIHHVYSRQVPATSGDSWNGLRFEVQLRTAVQHAWATAIEVYDSTQRARFKFEDSVDPAYEQFLIISEMFARVHEGRNASKPELTDLELVQLHEELESQTHMVSTIDSLNVADNYGHLKKDTILKRTTSGELQVYKFSNFIAAIKNIELIEKQADTENAVLVSAATPNHIRDAFRNYFDDTNDFVQLLHQAIHEIKSS